MQLIHSSPFSLPFPRGLLHLTLPSCKVEKGTSQNSALSALASQESALIPGLSPLLPSRPSCLVQHTKCTTTHSSQGPPVLPEGRSQRGRPGPAWGARSLLVRQSPCASPWWPWVPSLTHQPSLHRSHHTSDSTSRSWETEVPSLPPKNLP